MFADVLDGGLYSFPLFFYYVKPNAGLTDLLNSAKEDTSKLRKKDSLVVFGGTNDVERNLIGKNPTSVMSFLNATQHTNVILIDVPLRYDPGKRPHINEEIMNYNRKLHKVTKCFKHVKLVKATINREFFTQHRLHLNKKGKEMMSNKIIEKLLINVDSQEVDVIYLPWKIDSAKQLSDGHPDSTTQNSNRVVTPCKKNGKTTKEIPSTGTYMDGSKVANKSPIKKGIETRTVLCTNTRLEDSMKTPQCSSKLDVKTKDILSLDIHQGVSQESSKSPSKKSVWNKKILNKDTPVKEYLSTVTHSEDSKETARNPKL